MKRKYILIASIIILIGTIAVGYLSITNKPLAIYQSPDGNYQITIKNDRSIFSITMPGDGGMGSVPVKVILKDVKGRTIGSSNSNDKCGVFIYSIEIEWDLENNEVRYARGKTINLKTGKVGC